MAERPYRLGLDMGTNSLGWFMLWLDSAGRPHALGPGGVRVYPDGRDPQSGTSNAVDRREARSARRRRDRYLRRRADLMKALVRHGLMPVDAAERKIAGGARSVRASCARLGYAVAPASFRPRAVPSGAATGI
jgi:CRISPR-associated endonuclease Csn1